MKAIHGDRIRYKRHGDAVEREGEVTFVGIDGMGREYYGVGHEPTELVRPLISEEEVLAVVRRKRA